jgi:hypothetical protein
MRNETEHAIRVRISARIVRMNNPDSCTERDEQHTKSSEENLEELLRVRLGLPLRHAIQENERTKKSEKSPTNMR